VRLEQVRGRGRGRGRARVRVVVRLEQVRARARARGRGRVREVLRLEQVRVRDRGTVRARGRVRVVVIIVVRLEQPSLDAVERGAHLGGDLGDDGEIGLGQERVAGAAERVDAERALGVALPVGEGRHRERPRARDEPELDRRVEQHLG